jgi:hypothetical protein
MHPQSLGHVVLVGGIVLIERLSPLIHGGDDFIRISLAQLNLGPFANLIFRLFEQCEQIGNRCAVNLERLHERPAFVGHAINSAMLMVAIRIADVVLHVADEGVLPVDDVERAVGAD